MNEANETTGRLNMERIYVKDVSFESPQAPAIFETQWKPQIKLDLNTTTRAMPDERFEVDLRVTVTTKTDDELTSMVAEVTQSGVFQVSGFDSETQKRLLATMCPNILFPYIREQVDSLMVKGGFPPLHIAPVNFDAVYAQALQAEAEKAQGNTPQH